MLEANGDDEEFPLAWELKKVNIEKKKATGRSAIWLKTPKEDKKEKKKN